MKYFIVILGAIIIMTGSLKINSFKKENIRSLSKTQNTSIIPGKGSSNNKTLPYSYRNGVSGLVFMMNVKMPIKEMVQPSEEGC